MNTVGEARACEDGAHRAREYGTELLLPLYRPWTVKYTHLYVPKMPVFASILVNTVGESKQLRKKMCDSILDPGSS